MVVAVLCAVSLRRYDGLCVAWISVLLFKMGFLVPFLPLTLVLCFYFFCVLFLFRFTLPHLMPVISFDNIFLNAFIRLATRWLCDTLWWITNRIEIYVLFAMENGGLHSSAVTYNFYSNFPKTKTQAQVQTQKKIKWTNFYIFFPFRGH